MMPQRDTKIHVNTCFVCPQKTIMTYNLADGKTFIKLSLMSICIIPPDKKQTFFKQSVFASTLFLFLNVTKILSNLSLFYVLN
jgi:hypothetical protein